MTDSPSLIWLRNDLRLYDNPAVAAACNAGRPVLFAYILADVGPLAFGGAQRWWLYHSLESLRGEIERRGGRLILRKGEPEKAILGLVEEIGARHVFWNRRYAGAHIETDKTIKSDLVDRGIDVQTFNGALLREPWELKTKSGGHYRVFTPFWKALFAAGPAWTKALPTPKRLPAPTCAIRSDDMTNWDLLPENPNWAQEFSENWTPGESGASDRLDEFLSSGAAAYPDARDCPAIDGTSRMSPHLAFGEISPAEIWRRTRFAADANAVDQKSADKFLSELAWRDFSYNLLFHFPNMRTAPLRAEFNQFPWSDDPIAYRRWCNGNVGVPIVDAGMRQLWRTGWMHNRVRMIAASFLVKNLLLPWQRGEEWFWDTLVDADPASNAASWQWVAGCGADAAPYFRIFNPVTQGEKFDPDGAYVREFVPEIAALPNNWIHQPWNAPEDVLQKAGVILGKNYPFPLVDLSESRKRALAAFQSLKSDSE